MRLNILRSISVAVVLAACGEQASELSGGAELDSLPPSLEGSVPISDPAVTPPPADGEPAETTGEAGVASSLGAERDLLFSKFDEGTALLPFGGVPFIEAARPGVIIGPDAGGPWGWGIGWPWVTPDSKQMPDGTPIGWDWNVRMNAYGAYTRPDVSAAVPLFRRGPYEFLAEGTPCDVGEDSEPVTIVHVVVNGRLESSLSVVATVADCGWSTRQMTPTELVDLLGALRECEVGAGRATTCVELPPLSAEDRQAATNLLAKPGLGQEVTG